VDLRLAVGLIAGAFLAGFVIGRISGRNAAPSVPDTPRPIDPAAAERARSVLAADGKIAAIKAYREAAGVGLKEAKDAVDAIEAGRS
jgi:hypothetical protein